jgi:TATA-box binding protein (TBP) (component of TFIID and TFIIIB)
MGSAIEMQEIEVPKDVSISTMSTTCKLGTTIFIEHINNYMELRAEDVVVVKYKNTHRALDPALIKKRKPGRKVSNFFNQITLLVVAEGERRINTKLFTNGSVQMTGCKSLRDCDAVLSKLVERLKEVHTTEDGEEKRLVENVDNLKVSGFKVDMINSNFRVGYRVHREALHGIVRKMDIHSSFKPDIHACVNIKYPVDADKRISVFVFESGQIIITGAKNGQHIHGAYNFITKLLEDNKAVVRKKDVFIM